MDRDIIKSYLPDEKNMEIRTVTFYSNYFNHHQKSLCDELYKLLGDGFTFVETMPMEEFRASMGWGENAPSYTIRTYESEEVHKKAMELSISSDVVIMGTAPEIYVEERLKDNKLTFRYSERPLKEGFIKFFIPRLTKKYLHLHVSNRNKNMYVLAASAFTSLDFKKMFNSYKNKCYKFGYFPVHKVYDINELMERKERLSNGKISILWLGRMLKLKRPDLVIKAAARLKKDGYDFTLHMVGEGEMRPVCEKLVKDLGLENNVTFEDFLSPDDAREKMADYKVYVMTSNKLEGWGSVIYEGLNAGCAVVASHICGATPWLVEDKKCGLVFKSGSVDSLYNKLKYLFDNQKLIKEYGVRAYNKMHDKWNPQNAAKSILQLSKGLLLAGADGKDNIYPLKEYEIVDGPCSRATDLRNNWYKE